MKTSRESDIVIEPLELGHLGDLSQLFFRRCNFLKFGSADLAREYLKRNLESKSYLHGYAIKKRGRIVGSSCMVRAGERLALLLFTVSEEGDSGVRP